MSDAELERLKKRRDQLNAQIQRKAAKKAQAEKKARDARLMRWGVVVDAMIQAGELPAEKWADKCNCYLVRETDRRRAFTGPLADPRRILALRAITRPLIALDPAGDQIGADQGNQGRDPASGEAASAEDAGSGSG